MFSADFETVVDNEETRVWAWGVVEIGNINNFVYGNSGNGFLEWVESRTESTKIYFHNLKFDGEFLLYILNENGYKFYSKEDQKNDKKLPQGYYSTLINADGGLWYSLKLCLKRNKNKVVQVEFRDSLKIIPLPVEKMAKAFGLEISKLSIDYKKKREKGYTLTDDEIEYLKHDCIIVASCLKFLFDKGLDRMTIGSNALHNFKKLMLTSQYDYFFPQLNYDYDVRQSYKGGWTYCKPEIKGKDIETGIILDVNSLYPYVMYDKLLPFGQGLPFKGKYIYDKLYPLYILQVQLDFEIKPDHLPCIQIRDSFFNSREWLTSSKNEYPVLTLTNIDWELIQKHYNLFNVEYIGGWKFKANRDIFKTYINYWNNEKVNASIENNAGKRNIAKLMLNSLYGKFGSKPYVRNKEPFFDNKGYLHYKNTELEEKDTLYVPMASFITAYAREKTISTAQKLYSRFLYSDTDSIHLTGHEKPDIEIHDTELGAWAYENKFIRARYLGAKCYYQDLVNESDGEVINSVTVAGLPDYLHDQVTWENFHVGARYVGKLSPKRIKGGINLTETDYIIRPR